MTFCPGCLAWLGEQGSILGRISAGFQTFGMAQTEAELCVTQHSGAILGFLARFVSHPARKDLLTSLSAAAQKERDFLGSFKSSFL